MTTTSDGDGGTQAGVGMNLATLVPTFDPSKDDMQTYQQKVELLMTAWPKTKIPELVTRLILITQLDPHLPSYSFIMQNLWKTMKNQ